MVGCTCQVMLLCSVSLRLLQAEPVPGFNCGLQQVDGVTSHAPRSKPECLEYLMNTGYYRAFNCAFSSGGCKAFSLRCCLLINKGLCSDITYVPPCLVRAAGLIANDKRPSALLMKFT